MTVLVAFRCPACSAMNPVSLLAVSRSGGATCVACSRRLRAGDVSRALVRPVPVAP